ncbi:hypothetical protein QJS04_geneDACA016885 [Acorus gramineus]|uniref:Uncharacterized protein n=1 Tax=Acorus gramineus TaxID=55184 RepID=A0AAV9BP38_ACOGR|nr:hypothetical protein QJS04_geneDACA016885 [Acorus gramineus]
MTNLFRSLISWVHEASTSTDGPSTSRTSNSSAIRTMSIKNMQQINYESIEQSTLENAQPDKPLENSDLKEILEKDGVQAIVVPLSSLCTAGHSRSRIAAIPANPITVDDPSSQSEEGAEEVVERSSPTVVDSDIEEDSVHGPFPGGPKTNELLVDYRHHIAYRVWNGKSEAQWTMAFDNILLQNAECSTNYSNGGEMAP